MHRKEAGGNRPKAAMPRMEPGTGTCRGSNAPEEPWETGEAAMLRRSPDPGTSWNSDIPEEPTGNRPGPQGLGRNPTGASPRRKRRRENPSPAKRAESLGTRRLSWDSGGWWRHQPPLRMCGRWAAGHAKVRHAGLDPTSRNAEALRLYGQFDGPAVCTAATETWIPDQVRDDGRFG